MTSTRRFGWVPDLPDQRDHLYAAPPPVLGSLPSAVDLRPGCPEVWDQGTLGSCTAHAIGAAVEFERRQHGLADLMPSRLFIYFNERVMEHTVPVDAGAQIRDGIKSVAAQGVCPESLWPYDVARFAAQPTRKCYQEALRHRAIGYQRVPQTLAQLKGALAHGHPVVFGFQVYESFETDTVASTGVVPMPAQSETPLGGHAVLAVGYDDTTGRFLVRSSWSERWGDKGHCAMPYAYLTDRALASDFWAITSVAA